MPVNATGPGARRRFCAEFGPDEAPGEGLCDPGDAPCDPGDAIFAGQKGPSGVLQDLGFAHTPKKLTVQVPLQVTVPVGSRCRGGPRPGAGPPAPRRRRRL